MSGGLRIDLRRLWRPDVRAKRRFRHRFRADFSRGILNTLGQLMTCALPAPCSGDLPQPPCAGLASGGQLAGAFGIGNKVEEVHSWSIFSPQLNVNVKPAAKHPHLAAGYAIHMDAETARLQNLRYLTERLIRSGLKQKEAALKLDLSASHLSQLIGGKTMGPDVARKIEAAQSLPRGWMDQAHEEILYGARVNEPIEKPFYLSRDEFYSSQSLRVDPATMEATLKLLRLAIENVRIQGLEIDTDFESNALPIALAYEYLFRQRQQSVTPENVIDFSRVLAEKMREKNAAVTTEEAGTGHARGTG